MHTARSAGAYFEELQGCVPFRCPSLFLPPFYVAHSRYEHVTLLTARDAKGNVYGLAGKAKRLQAFHRYPPSLSSDCVFMRAEIPENKSRHTPGRSFPKVDDTTEIVLQNFLSRTRERYKMDHQLLFISFDITIFSAG